MRLKIRALELIGLEHRYPPGKEYGASRALVSRRRLALVKLTLDNGVVGWGEALGAPEIVAGYWTLLAPHFEGADPLDREVIWQRILSHYYHLGIQNGLVAAYSGINVAIYDALAKTLEVPVHKLLGGRARDRVVAYASDGYFTRNPDEDLERQLRAEAGSGFTAYKIKIGQSLESDVRRCALARSIIGDDAILMVDVNGNYTVDRALESMRLVAPFKIHFYEEPLPPQDYAGYAALARRAPLPVAAGEAHYTAFDFHRLFGGGLDIAQPDIASVGGFDEALKIATLGKLHNKRLIPHVWGSGVGVAAAIQFIAALPTYPHGDTEPDPVFLEYDVGDNPLRHGFLKTPIAVDRGVVTVGDAPGLGIEVDEEALQRFRLPL
jgi:D-galactarolactone cycloisomerase